MNKSFYHDGNGSEIGQLQTAGFVQGQMLTATCVANAPPGLATSLSIGHGEWSRRAMVNGMHNAAPKVERHCSRGEIGLSSGDQPF